MIRTSFSYFGILEEVAPLLSWFPILRSTEPRALEFISLVASVYIEISTTRTFVCVHLKHWIFSDRKYFHDLLSFFFHRVNVYNLS
jgi:hypothetical protein